MAPDRHKLGLRFRLGDARRQRRAGQASPSQHPCHVANHFPAPPKSASPPRGGRAAHVWACSTGDARREREQQRLRAESWQNASETWDVWGRVVSSRPTCPLGEPRRGAGSRDGWCCSAAHRHRSVLKRRSCRHRGGDRARRAHDKTCVRDGGELGRGWWAENASRYGRAGPRRAPRRNRALRTNRRNRRTDSPSPNTTRGPPPPVSQSENSDCRSPCKVM